MYYKIARPDGWDFFTGETINYREAIGTTVKCPASGNPALCSPTVLHASDIAEQCFIGGKIPCSLYRVDGAPVVSDNSKHGFTELAVLEELDPPSHFKWRYAEAANPFNPFSVPAPTINNDIVKLLQSWRGVWDSVGASVWVSVGVSVRASVRASVRDSVWDSVGDSVWAYIGWIFEPIIADWKYVTHSSGVYPFQSAVDLWRLGLMPSFDGNTWRLHGGPDAAILYEMEKGA